MKVEAIGSLIATILVVTITTVAQAEEFGDINRGYDFAARTCAVCHAIGKNSANSPEPDAPPFQAVANMASTTRLALAVWFRSPHPTMPNLILGAENTNDVIAYILSLKDRP